MDKKLAKKRQPSKDHKGKPQHGKKFKKHNDSSKSQSHPDPTSTEKPKFNKKKYNDKMNLDPKLKNKNHQQKAKNWKDAAAASTGPKTSEDEQRSLLRKTYNSLMENQKELEKARQFIEKILQLMGDSLSKYGFKRDGSHIIQACINFGSEEQIGRIKKACKSEYYKLMSDKYGRFLAKKLYDTSFDDLEKKAVLDHICNNMEKYITHMHATEMIEHLFLKSKTPVKERLFEASFGAKLKFFKETESIADKEKIGIAQLFAEHPLIKEQIMGKLSEQVDTFVAKGLIRLQFIQKIVLFYVRNATQAQLAKTLEEAHKNYLALLGSRDGLYSACILLVAADAKLRKHMLKQLKTENENLVDNMLISHLGTLFLLKILLVIDDTVLTKKLIIDRILELLPDIIENQYTTRMMCAICTENIGKYYANDDVEILKYSQFNTSRKEDSARKQEIMEHFIEGLSEALPNLMADHLNNRGFSEFLGELISHILVQNTSSSGKKVISCFTEIISKPEFEISQFVVDIIKKSVENECKTEKEPWFSKEVIGIIKSQFEKWIKSKGVFAIGKILKIEKLKTEIHDKVVENKAKIEEFSKTTEHNKGLEELIKYIAGQAQTK